ncbi:MAG: oligosaccharide flippase family protein [Ardenticatenales bacterium]|nr:oligosaccharide flippase family protein [Ardenticatenales bacterium]
MTDLPPSGDLDDGDSGAPPDDVGLMFPAPAPDESDPSAGLAATEAAAHARGAEAGTRRLVGSAALLGIGNVASRVLGFIRDAQIAQAYGGGVATAAFSIAERVPKQIYVLLIGGQLSAALVPTLAHYGAAKRDELTRAVAVLLSAAAAATGLVALGVYAFATPLAEALVLPESPLRAQGGLPIVAQGLRIMAPACVLFAIGGVVTGLLYALERFSAAVLAGAAYNLGMLLAVFLLRDRLGPAALPTGVVLGSAIQLAVLLYGARGLSLHLTLRLRHSVLRRVLTLYAPIAAGLVITDALVPFVDAGYSSLGADAAPAWLAWATRLVQFPHGFISTTIALAILPALAAAHARGETQTFARTLARGMRLVVALTLPAAVGMAVLAGPIVALAYERGAFVAADRVGVALALQGFLIGLPFAAIDLPLNYAFYARGNTWLPALIGVLSVGVWWLVARFVGPPAVHGPFPQATSHVGLALADSAKHAAHAAALFWLVRRSSGSEVASGLVRTAAGAAAAAGIMGAVVLGLDLRLAPLVPGGLTGWAMRGGLGAVVGVALYVPLAARLGVREIGWIAGIARSRLRPG